jgi:hypothetical protein
MGSFSINRDSIMITIISALNSLRPGAIWSVLGDTYEDIQWLDENQTKPTKKEISTELERLKVDYDLKEYQRLRAPEYPPKEDFIDAYYWAQRGDNTKMNEYLEKCDDVKIKYPKP